MGIETHAQASVTAVMIAAATGQLPKLVREVQIAQYKLLKDSQPTPHHFKANVSCQSSDALGTLSD